MTVLVSEVYEALKQAGIQDDTAKAAAKAVISVEDKETLATKADLLALKADMAELKTDIIKWNMALMISMTGIFAAIVKIFQS